MEYGIDVSDNNSIDLGSIRNENAYVYIKATEGRSYINKTLDKQYKQAKAAGYKIGFYHYAWNHPEEESKFFKNVISKYSYDLMPCIDIEEPSIKNSLDADDFIIRFSAGFGGVNKMLIYTGLSYYHEKINKITGANMWIAAYGQSKPTLRDNKLLMWQYTDKAYGATDRSEIYTVPYVAGGSTVATKPQQKPQQSMGVVPGANCVVKNDFFYTRDSRGNKVPGRIDIGDKIRVIDVSYSKQLCYVEYPVKGGTKKAYIVNSSRCLSYLNSWKSNGNKTVFDNDKRTKIGSISSGELVYILSKNGGMWNIVYSTSKGSNTKSGWIYV